MRHRHWIFCSESLPKPGSQVEICVEYKYDCRGDYEYEFMYASVEDAEYIRDLLYSDTVFFNVADPRCPICFVPDCDIDYDEGQTFEIIAWRDAPTIDELKWDTKVQDFSESRGIFRKERRWTTYVCNRPSESDASTGRPDS